MAQRVRRRQDDNRAARPPYSPLRHRRDRQRQLALQKPRRRSRNPRSSRLRNPGQLRRAERYRQNPPLKGVKIGRRYGVKFASRLTREHPKIDRIACPWLIRRFLDPNAEFIYVPKDQVLAVAQQTGGIPYDIDGVEFTHEGDRCSFDTILRIYDIRDPALDHLATIVRGADTSRHDLSPQCGGLFAISLGLSANFPDDHEMLKHGMVIYDALYTWCRTLQAETHNWPARVVGA